MSRNVELWGLRHTGNDFTPKQSVTADILDNMIVLRGMGVEKERVCVWRVSGWVVRAWLYVCVYCLCVCVCEGTGWFFWTLGPSKGAFCAAISLWDSGTGSRAQKQSSLLISWQAGEQVSQSASLSNNQEKQSEALEGARHNVWTCLCLSLVQLLMIPFYKRSYLSKANNVFAHVCFCLMKAGWILMKPLWNDPQL